VTEVGAGKSDRAPMRVRHVRSTATLGGMRVRSPRKAVLHHHVGYSKLHVVEKKNKARPASCASR
jgi:hypothetical protein